MRIYLFFGSQQLLVKKTLELIENVRLAPLTTLKIGGRARFFVRAESEEMLLEAFDLAERNALALFVLGGGSNVLISDRGFEGLVIQIASKGIVVNGLKAPRSSSAPPDLKLGEPVYLTVQAGEDWDEFVAYCVEKDLAGIECLSGIPGFVGATPVQNVGAYGQEVSETIVSVRCFDRKTKEFVALANADCGFSYRTSIFNSTERESYIVWSVTLALHQHGEPKIAYKDLIDHFGGRRPSLAEVRDSVLKIRRSKSMVIDPDDPNSRSAGSFFKNPIVERGKLEEITVLFERVPYFDLGDRVKIPAAWLIKNAGFKRGFVLGNAGISTNHTLAIINRGNASAEEILSLKETIEEAVDAKFGIVLQPEPIFIGF